MVPGRIKLQLFAFLLLSGGVIANILVFQPLNEARQVAQAPADPADRYADFGNTGTLGSEAPRPRYADGVRTQADDRKSAQASDVTKAVQRELRLRGYETGGSDGVETLTTRAAIMAFEYDHGMRMTGRSSQPLLKSILLGEGETGTRAGAKGGQAAEAKEVILFVQERLAQLGYRPGAATGEFGTETKVAIRKFERDQALPVSGRVSGPLITRLERLSADGRIAAGP